MIFVDKIDNDILMAKYLRLRLPERMRREKRSNYIIYTFMVNLTTISRIQFLAELRSGETQIWIYTECVGIGINLLVICCAIQFKISNYIILPKLF